MAAMSSGASTIGPFLSAERAQRLARIQHDYDSLAEVLSAEYGAMVTEFPGGLDAFLRQLKLVNRERRADLSALLSPSELESLELHVSPAGRVAQELLADVSVTEAQRLAVCRLQSEFDERFTLSFDAAPAGMLEREKARCQTQEKIREILGDEVFVLWLRGEGPDIDHFKSFVATQGLPTSVAIDLWRAKNDYTLRRLSIVAAPDMTNEQSRRAHDELCSTIRSRLASRLGVPALQSAGHQALGWLPRK
jgi:hypothetical protein